VRPEPGDQPSPGRRERWLRAQEHERRYWEDRGDPRRALAQREPRYAQVFARVAEQLPGAPRVVDVGSGPTCWGRVFPGMRVYVDPLMASYRARWGDQLPEGFLLAAAGESLPLRSRSCDLVLSLNAIDHCADPQAVIRECARVARPGGLIAVSVYAHPPLRAALRRLREGLGLGSAPHPLSFTRGTLVRLVERGGLEVLEVLDLGCVSSRTRPGVLKRRELLVLGRAPA